MKKIIYNKDIFVLENFLSKEECVVLIEKSEQLGYEEAKVQMGGNRQSILKGVRNNDRILYTDETLAKELFQRAKPFLNNEVGMYEVDSLNEMFRFYKYSPGQRFKMHRDGSFKRNEKEESFFTFLIYLNEEFEGGETEFYYQQRKISPKKGTMVIAPAGFTHSHRGNKPVSGDKYIATSWIMFNRAEQLYAVIA